MDVNKKMILQETVASVVSRDTGELIEETGSKKWSISKEVEPFFFTYSKALSILYNIKTAAAIKILWKLLDMSDFNRGIVRVTKADRVNICRELDITGQTYYTALAQLKELGIIEGSGGYMTLNPDIMWKGDSETRKKLVRSGCSITFKPVESPQREKQVKNIPGRVASPEPETREAGSPEKPRRGLPDLLKKLVRRKGTKTQTIK